MIPLQLRLQNFMSYAELDLDFRGIHSAVLSGPNGAGKSGLLDAITYALWDRARSGGEQLIRLGQSEMWVELQFGLDDRVYRVTRRRVRKTGAQSQLELHQLQDDGEAFVSLTGSTIRETQARINATVGMDYETFVNSAFILQGRADQFTTKTPRERKALLGDILGLQDYDDLSQRARERWKASQQRADALEAEQQTLRDELAARDGVAARLETAKEALRTLALTLAQAQSRQSRLVAEEPALRAAEGRLVELETARRAASADEARLAAELAAHEASVEAARASARDREAIEADHREWQALVTEDLGQRARADAYHAVELRLAAERQAAQAERHRLDLAVQALAGELAALEKERAGHLELAGDRERVETAFAALAAARAAEAAHMEREQGYRELAQRRAAVEQQLQLLSLRKEDERREREARLSQLRTQVAGIPALERAIGAVAAEVEALALVAIEYERVREQGFQFRAKKEQAETAIESARASQTALAAKIDQLEADSAVGAGARRGDRPPAPHGCPLCETPLTPTEIAKIVSRYQEDLQALADDLDRLGGEVADHEQALVATRAQYAELNDRLKRREADQQKLGQLKSERTALEGAEKEVARLEAEAEAAALAPMPPALAEELAIADEALASLAYDPAELARIQARVQEHRWAETRHWQLEQAQAALAAVDARLPALEAERRAVDAEAAAAEATWTARERLLSAERDATGHDAAASAATRARLAALADVPTRWEALQKQLLWLESAATLTARLEAERAGLGRRVAELALEEAGLARQIERLPLWEGELAAVDAELRRLRDEERQRHEELGRLEAELARLGEVAERLTAREVGWQTAIEEAQAYKELHLAFGKDGIQALIIENAIPELEEEANRLLARISDNRMHVRLATQKEKKSGGVNETLEIYISDEVGTRNYELYSGGEAFRVNFALRLALSRLLTRRAGTRLQTLVIDEGFGTQDEQGRERLVEAINAVSGEFERILVITHIRELKDAFNTHIEISKRGGVSHVKLSA